MNRTKEAWVGVAVKKREVCFFSLLFERGVFVRSIVSQKKRAREREIGDRGKIKKKGVEKKKKKKESQSAPRALAHGKDQKRERRSKKRNFLSSAFEVSSSARMMRHERISRAHSFSVFAACDLLTTFLSHLISLSLHIPCVSLLEIHERRF